MKSNWCSLAFRADAVLGTSNNSPIHAHLRYLFGCSVTEWLSAHSNMAYTLSICSQIAVSAVFRLLSIAAGASQFKFTSHPSGEHYPRIRNWINDICTRSLPLY